MKDQKKVGNSWRCRAYLAIVAAGTVAFVYLTQGVFAGPTGQTSFASAEKAVTSLVDAVKANDMQKLSAILGEGSEDILSSGDDVADSQGRAKFIEIYTEANSLVSEGESKQVLILGKEKWPFPIPIVKKDKDWVFDTMAGREEILHRRIGRNELNTIQTCLAYVDAQREYAMKDLDSDGKTEYAQKFASDPGTKNGLYWKAKEGEGLSPLGSFAALASAEGYARNKEDKPTAYHGYYFKILFAQGGNATGGAYDYVVKGSMIGGFALVAYPAEYGNSGVMTFIVNHDGVVYQKDLGEDTEAIANSLEKFDPDKSWTACENDK
jgi:hypothetical protein